MVTVPQILQLIANGLVAGAEFGLLGIGFALMLGVAGRFNFAYSTIYLFGGYSRLHVQRSQDTWGSTSGSVLFLAMPAARCSAPATEQFIFRPIAKRAGKASSDDDLHRLPRSGDRRREHRASALGFQLARRSTRR